MVTVEICVGSSCYVRGSDRVAEVLDQLIRQHDLDASMELVGAFCMEGCSMGVSLRIGDTVYTEITPDTVEDLFHTVIKPLAEKEVQ